MSNAAPPPVPTSKSWDTGKRWRIFLIVMGVLLFFGGIGMQQLRLARPYPVTSAAMSPALEAGDQVIVQKYTLWTRKLRRGEIVMFATDRISIANPTLMIPKGQLYMKRVAGLPGEKVRIESGKLYINDEVVGLTNAFGEISYRSDRKSGENLLIPAGHYYVLGDNTTNSLDSRYFGTVSAKDLRGIVSYC